MQYALPYRHIAGLGGHYDHHGDGIIVMVRYVRGRRGLGRSSLRIVSRLERPQNFYLTGAHPYCMVSTSINTRLTVISAVPAAFLSIVIPAVYRVVTIVKNPITAYIAEGDRCALLRCKYRRRLLRHDCYKIPHCLAKSDLRVHLRRRHIRAFQQYYS